MTSDEALAEKIRSLKEHGQSKRYMHRYVGINGRLDAIQAAVLNVKLKYFPDEVAKRATIGERYTQLIADRFIAPVVKEDRTHVYAQYSIRVPNREKMIQKLNDLGVPTAIHYPMPLYRQEVFMPLKIDEKAFPVTEMVSDEIMSLPMSPFLNEAQQDAVVKALLS